MTDKSQIEFDESEPSHAECKALGEILDIIGSKWTIMVVGNLSNGPMRFNAILRSVGGVSHRMLTLTLRRLEQDGLVLRTAFMTIPPKVEYSLTDLGISLIQPLNALSQWASNNRNDIECARTNFETKKNQDINDS